MPTGHDTRSPYTPPNTPAAWHAAPPADAAAGAVQLRTLGVLHHIFGGLSLAGAMGFGLVLVFGIAQEAADGFNDPSGVAMIAVFGMLVALSLLGGGLCIWAGLHLMRHTRPGLCTLVAALCCAHVPLGTALGISTLVLLQRPDARAAFAAGPGGA